MEEDPRDANESSAITDDELEETFEQLLPVPEEPQPEPGQIDSPIDELLPVPGEESAASDDATTSEELEVDTTADGIDDIIPLGEPEEQLTYDNDVSDELTADTAVDEGEDIFTLDGSEEQIQRAMTTPQPRGWMIMSR